MGQMEDVEAVGGGTVRMGRRDFASMGGLRFAVPAANDFSGSLPEEPEVVDVGFPDRDGFCGESRPDTIGGGSSRPSAALRESWRAKSDACHHSRNFRAKMEVGRRIFRLERRRG